MYFRWEYTIPLVDTWWLCKENSERLTKKSGLHNALTHCFACRDWVKLRTGEPPTVCDDTRCCRIQFWPPDDEHRVLETCSRKTYYKTRICALSWLITKIILRCRVSKTSSISYHSSIRYLLWFPLEVLHVALHFVLKKYLAQKHSTSGFRSFIL